MTGWTLRRLLVGLLSLVALLAVPGLAAAQSSTFIIPFNVTFFNPCIAEDVAVTGSTSITTTDSITPQGDRKISVSEKTTGSGVGLVFGTVYPFSENTQFTVRTPLVGQEFDSTFTDRISMKGPKAIDNWTVKAVFRIKISATGQIVTSIERFDSAICRG